MKIIDQIGLPNVTEFIKDLLEDYHTDKLGNVYLTGVKVISKKSLRWNPIWGCCYSPDCLKSQRAHKGKYLIECFVNTNEAVYPVTHKHWFWIPDKTRKSGRRSEKALWKLDSVEEASIYILAHEIFHYLSWTNQLYDRDGKKISNLEANANQFAHAVVAKYSVGMPLDVKM